MCCLLFPSQTYGYIPETERLGKVGSLDFRGQVLIRFFLCEGFFSLTSTNAFRTIINKYHAPGQSLVIIC